MILASIFTITIPVLLCVAFFTLAERQIMASMQRRFGPHVSGIGGVLQPFWDGLKLGVKEPILPELSASGAFSAAPMISFILSQISWCGIFISDATFQGLVLMAISSLAVYGVMLAGWASNSKYAFLGCLRSVALMVSYELSLGAALLSIGLFMTDSSGMKCLNFADAPTTVQFALLPLCHIFLICILAETKRVPFDLPEAKSLGLFKDHHLLETLKAFST
jgi:NADH:ubiquinone oxidoreductase subunit H